MQSTDLPAFARSRAPGRFLEDVKAGDVFSLGPVEVDRDEMLGFAHRYDPQPFHQDPEAARRTLAGELIASGWFTGSLAMRMLCDAAPFGENPILGTGIEGLRWPTPVRAGDKLAGIARVVEVRPSSKRSDRGTVRLEVTLRNGRSEQVFRMIPSMVLMRRSA